MSETLLSVRDLRVGFATEGGRVQAVDGASFELTGGEVLAIVGESGSGKSVTAQAIMGLVPPRNARIAGSVRLRDRELIGASDAELQEVRGEEIAMIFQDPMTSLNPVYRVGTQIVEAIQAHQPEVGKDEARRRAIELLDSVGIREPQRRVDSYPHEFSGGMRQRAMIAMALALEPAVLIADEPTTALDVTIQAQILRLLEQLNRERNLATILITHDLGVVAEVADRVLVMHEGKIVERGNLEDDAGAVAGLNLLRNAGLNAPGMGEWARVVDTPTQSDRAVGVAQPFQIEFGVSPTRLAASSAPIAEGGLISLDADATDLVHGNFLGNVSERFVRTAFGANSSSNAAAGGFLLFGDSDAVAPQTSWNLNNTGSASSRDLDSLDFSNYLGALDAAPNVDDDVHLDSTPILRITPVKPNESEGGTIDLTAMAGPTTLQSAAPSSSFPAESGDERSYVGQIEQSAARPASLAPIENLRARAVVYEVALNRSSNPSLPERSIEGDRVKSADDRTDAAAPGARTASPRRDEGPLAHDRRGPESTSALRVPASAGTISPKALPPAPSANDAASLEAASALDAAFARWGDREAVPMDAEHKVDAASSATRKQRIGLAAIALVVGVSPLIKRARRTRPSRVVEQAAGLL